MLIDSTNYAAPALTSLWRGLEATSGAQEAERRTTGVKKIGRQDLQWLPALCDLLIDGVHRGASLGFLAPLSRYAAMAYWHGVFARLGPNHSLWIACAASSSSSHEKQNVGPLPSCFSSPSGGLAQSDGSGGAKEQLLGAVQLSFCPQVNAHHRGEIQGLMVHSRARGKGVASLLMARLECAAATQGRTLLVLEAPSGSQAEAVYVHLGWQHAGEIPDYDASADGNLQHAALYFKRLKPLRARA